MMMTRPPPPLGAGAPAITSLSAPRRPSRARASWDARRRRWCDEQTRWQSAGSRRARPRAPVDQLLQTIDQEVGGVMTMHHRRVRGKQRAGTAIAHVRLERQHAFTPNQRQDLIQELEQLHVVALGRRSAFEALLERAGDA